MALLLFAGPMALLTGKCQELLGAGWSLRSLAFALVV